MLVPQRIPDAGTTDRSQQADSAPRPVAADRMGEVGATLAPARSRAGLVATLCRALERTFDPVHDRVLWEGQLVYSATALRPPASPARTESRPGDLGESDAPFLAS